MVNLGECRVCCGVQSAWGVHQRCIGWSEMYSRKRHIATKVDYFVKRIVAATLEILWLCQTQLVAERTI